MAPSRQADKRILFNFATGGLQGDMYCFQCARDVALDDRGNFRFKPVASDTLK